MNQLEVISGIVPDDTASTSLLKEAMDKYLSDPSIASCNEFIDVAEAILMRMPPAPLPVSNLFPNGIYVRRCMLVAGSMVVSHIHAEENAFVVMEGKVAVFSHNEGCQIYEGPMQSVTSPCTRRILFAFENTVWITFHPNPDNITDVDALVRRLTVPRKNKLIGKI